jgi:hypothetical protein
MTPKGQLIKKIDIKDAPPPPYRPTHELRAIRRESIPRALTAKLPPDTIHYGIKVVGVSATETGMVA